MLDPGDSFGVGRIDSGSFSEKDILVRMTFDERPTMANAQKRQFKATVDDFTDPAKAPPTPTSPGASSRRSSGSTRSGRGRRSS